MIESKRGRNPSDLHPQAHTEGATELVSHRGVPLQNETDSGAKCQCWMWLQCLMAQGKASSIPGIVSNSKICIAPSLLISKFRFSVSLLRRKDLFRFFADAGAGYKISPLEPIGYFTASKEYVKFRSSTVNPTIR